MVTILEVGQQMIRGERELFPIPRLQGMTMTDLEPGRAVFTLAVDEWHHNPLGTLHGCVHTDLADPAMGWGSATLDEGESFTTIELKINFLRPLRQDTLTAEAKVVQAGSTVGYVEGEVTNRQGRLVARASSTCLKRRMG